jgi:hypothetical protein
LFGSVRSLLHFWHRKVAMRIFIQRSPKPSASVGDFSTTQFQLTIAQRAQSLTRVIHIRKIAAVTNHDWPTALYQWYLS